MDILIPKRWIDSRLKAAIHERPFVFLAGPIRGGGDWQHRMCVALNKINPKVVIACPCRWTDDHPLASHFLPGSERHFDRQLEWERYYLAIAGEQALYGCVLFWLPLESKTDPHPGPEPYAMDTRGELGEWRWRMKNGARVVVGAKAGFLGLSQIQRNFAHALGRDFPMYPTIESTAGAALAHAMR